jgi:hypothetical protein
MKKSMFFPNREIGEGIQVIFLRFRRGYEDQK